MASESNSWKLVVAAGASAAVTAVAMWATRSPPPPPPPVAPTAPAAAEPKERPAPAPEAAEQEPVAAPEAASPAVGGELPVAPEVGQAAPDVAPAVKVPKSDEEIRAYLGAAVDAVGPVEAQLALRSARWTLDVRRGVLAGRVVAEIGPDRIVLEHAASGVRIERDGDRCRALASGVTMPCQHHEQILVTFLAEAQRGALPAIWRAGVAGGYRVVLEGEANTLRLWNSGFAGRNGACDRKAMSVALQFDAVRERLISLEPACLECAPIAYSDVERFGAVTFPRRWYVPRGDRRTEPDAEPKPGQRKAELAAECAELDVTIVEVEAAPVGPSQMADAKAESAPRIETRPAQTLLVAPAPALASMVETLEELAPSSNDVDRSGKMVALLPGEGLRIGLTARRTPADAAKVLLPAGKVARQRSVIAPSDLAIRLREFREAIGSKHKLADVPAVAWPLRLDKGFGIGDERPRPFEFEVAIAE
ncbi:MAG: hypothetical protein H6747_03930 [Deltaproteobacteria bacterium]|nr:hypothetical protein [Deltaproteobacteria bacterium]